MNVLVLNWIVLRKLTRLKNLRTNPCVDFTSFNYVFQYKRRYTARKKRNLNESDRLQRYVLIVLEECFFFLQFHYRISIVILDSTSDSCFHPTVQATVSDKYTFRFVISPNVQPSSKNIPSLTFHAKKTRTYDLYYPWSTRITFPVVVE